MLKKTAAEENSFDFFIETDHENIMIRFYYFEDFEEKIM